MDFQTAYENRLASIARKAVGATSGLSSTVTTFSDKLEDFPRDLLPALVIFCSMKEKESTEVAKFGNWVWTGQLYYLDLTAEGETWDSGKARRNTIVNTLEESYEGNHFLNDGTGGFSNTDEKGVREYVWQTEVTTTTFDQSGLEGYYTFVSEMYVLAHTSKN